MKGISFSGPMMLAWLEGRKTVTRRLVNPQPEIGIDRCFYSPTGWGFGGKRGCTCITAKPRYVPGETVYCKETWAQIWNQDGCIRPEWEKCEWPCEGCHIEYKADTGARYPAGWPDDSTGDPSCPKWKSPRFMPFHASRSHARIVSSRPERIRSITPEEVKKEGLIVQDFAGIGVLSLLGLTPETYMEQVAIMEFQALWETLHPESWQRNDWVWRIELEKI